ncbi:hypothetical protein DQR71_08955 [Salmonella enterica subsp. enterica serovar Kingston]|nr:hypothetical protein [Salmonella enterica subsp. enterica serovar Kingston]
MVALFGDVFAIVVMKKLPLLNLFVMVIVYLVAATEKKQQKRMQLLLMVIQKVLSTLHGHQCVNVATTQNITLIIIMVVEELKFVLNGITMNSF